jgi:hypothetical protein
VLAQIGGKGWTVVGSLNSGEVSAKLNRELALLVGRMNRMPTWRMCSGTIWM